MSNEIIIWLSFTVLVSLMPLALDYCGKVITTEERPKSEEFFSDGQLLLIAVAFGAESMGGILNAGKSYKAWELLNISACFIAMLCAAILYPYIVNTRQNSTMKDKKFVVRTTFTVFIFTLLSSLVCKYITL